MLRSFYEKVPFLFSDYSLIELYLLKVPIMDTMGVDTNRARLRVDCSSFKNVEAMM